MGREKNQAHAPSLFEVSGRVRKDIELLREVVGRETEELRRSADSFVQTHPLSAVGAAFGAGFLLSGGLFSRAAARTLVFGARFMMGRWIRMLVAGGGAGLLFPSETGPEQ